VLKISTYQIIKNIILKPTSDMNLFGIGLVVSVIIIVFVYTHNSDTHEESESSLDDERILELEEEQKRYEKQLQADLEQVRQTKLELTYDKKINSTVLLDGDYSDEYALIDEGIDMSSTYNRVSYEYSANKILTKDYLDELKKLKIQYEVYLEDISNKKWHYDIINHKNSLTAEYFKIKQEIQKIEEKVS